MAFTANDIKNLALMELNHETIADWTDTNNTDIEIINTQYNLAKPVALSMYQWSFAFKYTALPTTKNSGAYRYKFLLPDNWVVGSAFRVFTDSSMQIEITDIYHNTSSYDFYTDYTEVYIEYTRIGNITDYASLTGSENTNILTYKYIALLPNDFLGYLSCYTDRKCNILSDYLCVGSRIYTNSEIVYIKYIAEVAESTFTPEFVDWFKIFLAQRINGYLNGDMQRQALLNSEEPFFFRKAKNIDSKRNKHDSLDGNPILWIRGKLGGGM